MPSLDGGPVPGTERFRRKGSEFRRLRGSVFSSEPNRGTRFCSFSPLDGILKIK